MIPLTLADIAQVTQGRLHNITDANALVTAPISFDSRDIAPGGLFACLKGRTLDGHDFAAQAAADGAIAVLADSPQSGLPEGLPQTLKEQMRGMPV
ncbi:Mur ligase domain-containing protein [Streptomyces sp. NPDC001514]